MVAVYSLVGWCLTIFILNVYDGVSDVNNQSVGLAQKIVLQVKHLVDAAIEALGELQEIIVNNDKTHTHSSRSPRGKLEIVSGAAIINEV